MYQQPCCKWSVQSPVLYNKTLCDSRSMLCMHTTSCFQRWQQSGARFPRGCTATITTSLENKSEWSDLSSLQFKNTEGEHEGRSCLWQKYASCGILLYQQIYHSSETTSKKQINIFHFIYSPSEPMWEAFVFLSKKNSFSCKIPWMNSRLKSFPALSEMCR